MTFIDSAADPPASGQIAAFCIIAAVSLLYAYLTLRRGFTQSHYRSLPSVRYCLPFVCLVGALENATLASTGKLYETHGDGVDDLLYVQVLFVLQALKIPMLMVVTFELTYLVHKRRSVNFCGMYFDEGRRVSKTITTPMKSFVLRNFVRIVGVMMLVTTIIVNFDLIQSSVDANDVGATTVNQLAGRAGWFSFFDPDTGDWEDKKVLFLSLLPPAILAAFCFYLSLSLWRYGTNSAMVVHSSILNPWFSLFVGNLAMAGGQLFGENLYQVMSNAGILILIMSILSLMSEIDKDMVAAQQFTDFLAQVAQKGNALSVRHAIKMRGEAMDDDHQTVEGIDLDASIASVIDLNAMDAVDNPNQHHPKTVQIFVSEVGKHHVDETCQGLQKMGLQP